MFFFGKNRSKQLDAAATYDALSADQKALVDNYDTLVAAETVFASLAPGASHVKGACHYCGQAHDHNTFIGNLIGFVHTLIWVFNDYQPKQV